MTIWLPRAAQQRNSCKSDTWPIGVGSQSRSVRINDQGSSCSTVLSGYHFSVRCPFRAVINHHLPGTDQGAAGAEQQRGDGAPRAGDSVDAEQLQHYQAADLQDVFESSPEVSVGGGPGVAQKLYLRGLEDTLLNVTIDGANQPGQTFHHTGRIGIEPELSSVPRSSRGPATQRLGRVRWEARFVSSAKTLTICCAPASASGRWSRAAISAMPRASRAATACTDGSMMSGQPWPW